MIFDGFFKYNNVKRNRNRLVDDFSDRRARSHYSDRSKSMPRPSYGSHNTHNNSSSNNNGYNYIRQQTSSSILPRIKTNPPISVMHQTMTKKEPKTIHKDTINVEHFQEKGSS